MNRYGIAWIENYHGLQVDLAKSRDTATGFATSLGGCKAFDDIEDDCTIEPLFERNGSSIAFIEHANIFYFAGHATERSLVLGVRTGGDGIVTPEELKLGGSLIYAVFDSCSTLDPFFQKKWLRAFDGLHYMLGFSGSIVQDATRGCRFGRYLNQGNAVSEAWRRAAIETVGSSNVPWSFLRGVYEKMSLADDTWPNQRPLAVAAPTPFVFLSRDERCHPAVEWRAASMPNQVKFFRTSTTAMTEEKLQKLAGKFGLETHKLSAGPGWRELRNASSALYLYGRSGSFWWSRLPTQLAELFHAPEPALLPAVAIDKAREYLEQQQLTDSRLIPLPPSFTVETQREYRPDGHGDGRLSIRTVAYHVNYGFALEELPVLGPGAKLRVSFEGTEVSEVFRFWRETVEDGFVTIGLTAEGAIDKLRTSSEFSKLPDEAITFEGEPRLGYYARPVGLEQTALVPVYEIRGVVSTALLDRYEFTRYVNAVPDNLELQLPELVP